MKIIDWDPGYYPDISDADEAQKRCYQKLALAIKNGHYVDVGDNDSYLYYYVRALVLRIFDAFVKEDLPSLELEFRKFIDLYAANKPKPVSYAECWLMILACLQNKSAKEVIQAIDDHISFREEHDLSIAREWALVLFIHSAQVSSTSWVDPKYFLPFSIVNPKSLLTSTGKKYFNEIMGYVKQLIELDYEQTGVNFLYKIYDFEPGGLSIEGEEILCLRTQELEARGHEYDQFDNIPGLEIITDRPEPIKVMQLKIPAREQLQHTVFIKTLMREAENAFREDRGLKPVGEGWVSETLLFKQIKAALPGIRVLQHASPSFLGKQHYDIYIPKYKVAFEYQGEQHFQAISLFGGEDGLANAQERDQRKRDISYQNGVVLCEVLPGYDVEEVIDALYQVIPGQDPDATDSILIPKTDAINNAKGAMKDKDGEKNDFGDALNRISNQISDECELDAKLDARMNQLIDQASLSKFAGNDYINIDHDIFTNLLSQFEEIQKMGREDPRDANNLIFGLMEQGYIMPAAYMELAKNFRRLKDPKSELMVLIQGKKDYNYNFDNRIKKLIRKLDDQFL